MSTGLIGEPWRHTLVDQIARTHLHTHTLRKEGEIESERECVSVCVY